VSKELKVVEHLLDLSGIGRERLCLKWVSAAEGKIFADYVTQFSEKTRKLGPFDPEQFEEELAAIEKALSTPRLRLLMGAELQITERGNVYDEKLGEEEYHHLLIEVSEEEYQGALILNTMREGPKSVREIAFNTGLPVYTISLRLGELERRHQAGLESFYGTTPRYVSLDC